MSNEKNILQILDQSACLRKSQLLGYLNHTLYPEELRAVELHLSSCALCSDALEGMEIVQNAEQLINSIQLPVLPAVVIPEKVPEKKEPVVKVAEPVVMSSPKGRHAKTSLPVEKPVIETKIQPKKSNFLKPLGIAAALLIGGGAIWYYEKGQNNQEPNIALNTISADTAAAQQNIASAPVAANAIKIDSAAFLLAQKKKDSTYLAVRKAEKLKAQRDSMQLLAKADDTAPKNAVTDKAPIVAAMRESPAVASNDDAKPMAKQALKEEKVAAKPIKEESDAPASDFDMGMQKYRENNFASALLYFKTAESDNKNTKHWDAVFYSGMCNKSLNKKRKAIKCFQQIVDAKAPQAKAAQKQLDNLKGED